MLQRILPLLRTLLTSKIRGSTQHLWCRTRVNDFLLSTGDQPISHKKAHSSAGNFSCSKSLEMRAAGSPNSLGSSQQSCRSAVSPAPGEPLKPIRNIALCLYTTGEETPPTSALHCCPGNIQSGKERGLKLLRGYQGRAEKPGLHFSPHMTDRLHERTKPAPAQLQKNIFHIFLWQREER